MAEKSDKKSEGAGAEILFFGLAGLAIVVVLLIPAVVGLLLFVGFRRHLVRRDGVLLAVGSLVGLLVANAASRGGAIVAYVRWLGVLITGHGDRLDIPFAVILLGAGVVFGLIEAFDGSRVAAWGLKTFSKNKVGAEETVIPTFEDKQKMAVAPPPSEALAIHHAQHSASTSLAPGTRTFPIGVGAKRKPMLLSEAEIGTHVLVFGSTGSGKTVTLEVLAGNLLDLGWEGTIVDLKEDAKAGGFYDWCREYSHAHAISFQELRLSDPEPQYWFNPLEGMGPDEARDTILSLQEFQDAFWAALNRKALGQACTLFWTAHQIDPMEFPTPTMLDIGKFFEAPSLKDAAKKRAAIVTSTFPDQFSNDSFSALLRPTAKEAEAAAAFGARITGVYGTQAGRLVLSPSANAQRTPLDITQGGLTYIGLDSLGKMDLTKLVSSAVLQRLSVYASQRTVTATGRPPRPRFVLIDEAGFVDRLIVQNLLSRARSAGIAMILATQGPMDWETRSGIDGMPGFSMLAQNCNVGVIMSQREPNNAEMCAEFIGMGMRSQFAQSVREGELMEGGTISQRRDYLVSPDHLRELTIGEAVVTVGKPRSRVEWVKVTPRDARVGARV